MAAWPANASTDQGQYTPVVALSQATTAMQKSIAANA